MKYKVRKKKTPQQELKAEVNKINWKLHIVLVASVLAIFGLYQLCVYLNFRYIVHIYAVALAACALAFGIINHGFSRAKITADELPPDWDNDRKTAYIAANEKRRRLAKKFLIPAIGILVTFAFDIVYLFYLEPIIG